MKGKRANEVLDLLELRSLGRAYPGSAIGREPSWERTPFTVLLATVLSQRTRDLDTWTASESLFTRYSTPRQVMDAPEEEIAELIRRTNYHKGKAKAIKEIATIVCERFEGEVPSNLEDLMALPMVGRKTATCVLAHAFDMDTICVDTHVHRISNRLGLVQSNSPEENRGATAQDRAEVPVEVGQRAAGPLRPGDMHSPQAKARHMPSQGALRYLSRSRPGRQELEAKFVIDLLRQFPLQLDLPFPLVHGQEDLPKLAHAVQTEPAVADAFHRSFLVADPTAYGANMHVAGAMFDISLHLLTLHQRLQGQLLPGTFLVGHVNPSQYLSDDTKSCAQAVPP
jgi:endonuclease-3